MKLKKWSEKAALNAKDGQLFLRLLELPDTKNLLLSVVDKSGNKIEDGNVLEILSDRKCILLKSNLNPIVPLKTDVFNVPLTVSGTMVAMFNKTLGDQPFHERDEELDDVLNKRIASLKRLFEKISQSK